MKFIKDFVASNMFKYVLGLILIAIAYFAHLIGSEEAITHLQHLFGM